MSNHTAAEELTIDDRLGRVEEGIERAHDEVAEVLARAGDLGIRVPTSERRPTIHRACGLRHRPGTGCPSSHSKITAAEDAVGRLETIVGELKVELAAWQARKA